jgi:hypothetical protein
MNLRERIAGAWQERSVRVAVVVVLALLGIYIVGFLAGKRRGKGNQTSFETGESVPDPFVTEVAPQILASLHSALAGYSVNIDKKGIALQQLMALTDGQLRYVSNSYNFQYYAGTTDTLLQLIENEFVGFWYQPWLKIKEQVVARMRGLNIR